MRGRFRGQREESKWKRKRDAKVRPKEHRRLFCFSEMAGIGVSFRLEDLVQPSQLRYSFDIDISEHQVE